MKIPRAARRLNQWLSETILHHNGKEFIRVNRLDLAENSGITYSHDELNHTTTLPTTGSKTASSGTGSGKPKGGAKPAKGNPTKKGAEESRKDRRDT